MQTPISSNVGVGSSQVSGNNGTYVIPGSQVQNDQGQLQDPVAKEPQVMSKASDKKYKVMIVEDESDARAVFVEILSSVPEYEVLEADDGSTCLSTLESNKDVDLVLLDIVMPKVDGIDTLKQIKQNPDKYGSPIVVMLTNLGGDVAIETALGLGAVGFLMKISTDPQLLLEKVRQFLSGELQAPVKQVD